MSAKHRGDKQSMAARFGGAGKITGAVEVRVLWVRQRRTGDIDGRIKSLLDLLTGVAYDDDGQITRLVVDRSDETGVAPGMYVWVSPAGLADLTDLAA